MTRPSLKVLVVGAGPMGRHHGQAIERLDSSLASLAGFVDPDPVSREAVAGQFAVPALADLGEALASLKPDVAHICVPPAHHADLAMQCLRSGAHLYVEKPFTLRLEDAEEVLSLADSLGLRVSAGHQLLTDPASLAGEEYLSSLGSIRHVESYFAFRPRRETSGRRPRTPVEQLLDILPHPTYLLAHFLELGSGHEPQVVELDASEAGWAQVSVRAGVATGSLYVTLQGRPVNSFVRVIGDRGSLYLDYVRGLAIPKIWPGSGLDKVSEPYYEAFRLAWGSTMSLGRRVLKRERSYPGLRPMFEALYRSIVEERPGPVSRGNILFSVDLVEQVESRIAERRVSYAPPAEHPTVVVTGGTGFLGREVVKSLVGRGQIPLVWGRRMPPAHERVDGVHYEVRDLAEEDGCAMPDGIQAVVHCAAETAGSWEAHQRNSVDATRNLLRSAGASGVARFIHVSSLGVLSLKARPPISEEDPVEGDPRARGPYVWGKLESEQIVQSEGKELGLDVSIVRPGPLVDPEAGPPPGRLGRPVGPFFVAVGPGRGTIPTTDVRMAGEVLAGAASGEIQLPDVLHLLDPQVKTRRDLIREERARRRGVRVIWLPWIGVRMLSALATLAQKVLRPGSSAVSVASAFAAPAYSVSRIASLLGGSQDSGGFLQEYSSVGEKHG